MSEISHKFRREAMIRVTLPFKYREHFNHTKMLLEIKLIIEQCSKVQCAVRIYGNSSRQVAIASFIPRNGIAVKRFVAISHNGN